MRFFAVFPSGTLENIQHGVCGADSARPMLANSSEPSGSIGMSRAADQNIVRGECVVAVERDAFEREGHGRLLLSLMGQWTSVRNRDVSSVSP